jgi:hypothetical protein
MVQREKKGNIRGKMLCVSPSYTGAYCTQAHIAQGGASRLFSPAPPLPLFPFRLTWMKRKLLWMYRTVPSRPTNRSCTTTFTITSDSIVFCCESWATIRLRPVDFPIMSEGVKSATFAGYGGYGGWGGGGM